MNCRFLYLSGIAESRPNITLLLLKGASSPTQLSLSPFRFVGCLAAAIEASRKTIVPCCWGVWWWFCSTKKTCKPMLVGMKECYIPVHNYTRKTKRVRNEGLISALLDSSPTRSPSFSEETRRTGKGAAGAATGTCPKERDTAF